MRRRVPFYKKCLPDFSYKSIYEIPYNGLYIRGIEALFFDLDNTLVTYNQKKLSEKMVTFLQELSNFFTIIIISNNHKKRVLEAVGENFPFVSHAKKPFKFGYKKALKMAGLQPYKVAIIGDQLLTDIKGAASLGAARRIAIRPLRKDTEKWMTRFNRFFERLVIKKIKRKLPDIFDVRLGNFLSE
ncbi:YqeG family HAD IIIA-type phosphatase [Acholeplasma sp. OttesenSCG-928-E16]|nr:YqeG family HAD IIIA-type phosphatase [Acholeplasma sp. OttesenSCG-928-E16]